MQQTRTAKELVDVLQRKDGSKGVLRPVHAIGVGVSGFFVPSQVASDYCVAEHFKAKKTKVTVRFSNGSGCAEPHDGWSDVRGMATRFHLADGTATDLIAMTLPEFFTPTGDTFYDFAFAATPMPYTRESPWRKILDMLKLTLPLRDPYPEETISPDVGAMRFADTQDSAKIGVFEAATIGAPVSYVRAAYHACTHSLSQGQLAQVAGCVSHGNPSPVSRQRRRKSQSWIAFLIRSWAIVSKRGRCRALRL